MQEKSSTIDQSAGAVEYTDSASLQRSKTPASTGDLYWGWGSINDGTLENVENSFIAITFKTALAGSGSNW